MPIRLTCTCGKTMQVADQHAGKTGKCPACGAAIRVPAQTAPVAQAVPVAELPQAVPVAEPAPLPQAEEVAGAAQVQPLQYSTPSALAQHSYQQAGPIAPPPGPFVNMPTAVNPKFNTPGAPPMCVTLSVAGADIDADVDLSLILQSFVDGLAKSVRKTYNVFIGPPQQPGMVWADIRIARVDEGNRWLRYFLTLFAGKTIFEIEGRVLGSSGAAMPVNLIHKGSGGLFGGGALGLLRSSAGKLGAKVGKMARQAR